MDNDPAAVRTIYEQTARGAARQPRNRSRERVVPRLLPKRLARKIEAEQFSIVAVRAFSGLNSADALSKVVGSENSAPAPGSGDRRRGQFALAKGKLHGLLSGAEPSTLPRRSKCWEARQRIGSGARSFSEGRLRPLGRSHCAWLTCWCSSRGRALRG